MCTTVAFNLTEVRIFLEIIDEVNTGCEVRTNISSSLTTFKLSNAIRLSLRLRCADPTDTTLQALHADPGAKYTILVANKMESISRLHLEQFFRRWI